MSYIKYKLNTIQINTLYLNLQLNYIGKYVTI